MGCSESRESTPVLIFTPSSSETLSLLSDDQRSVDSGNRNEAVGSKELELKQYDDETGIDDQVEHDETEGQQQSFKTDNISISSKHSNDQRKININEQEQGNEDITAEVKTGESKNPDDKLAVDLQMSLKNILIKAEKKKKQIFAIRSNKSDEATIHFNRSFCDTAPVSPVISKEQVEAKASPEVNGFWDDEPIETAETDASDDHSPW